MPLFMIQASYPLTTRLYLLFWPGKLGLLPPRGGVFEPLPFMDGRWLLESDLPDEARVVGGDALSNHELSVDELLFPLLVCCERCSSLPSLLEEEFWSDAGVLAVLAVLNDAFDRRRRLRSLRKEGIARDCAEAMSQFLRSMCGRRKRGEGEMLLLSQTSGCRPEMWKPRSTGKRELRWEVQARREVGRRVQGSGELEHM